VFVPIFIVVIGVDLNNTILILQRLGPKGIELLQGKGCPGFNISIAIHFWRSTWSETHWKSRATPAERPQARNQLQLLEDCDRKN